MQASTLALNGSAADRDPVVVSELTKTYPGPVEAVRGLSFRVGAGEIFGLLGPNGAGKTTTVGVLTSVISAYYYLNVVRQMFFQGESEDTPVRYPALLNAALVVTLVGTLVMNIFPAPFLNIIGDPMDLIPQALLGLM